MERVQQMGAISVEQDGCHAQSMTEMDDSRTLAKRQ
jgi:hypothetical protein